MLVLLFFLSLFLTSVFKVEPTFFKKCWLFFAPKNDLKKMSAKFYSVSPQKVHPAGIYQKVGVIICLNLKSH